MEVPMSLQHCSAHRLYHSILHKCMHTTMQLDGGADELAALQRAPLLTLHFTQMHAYNNAT